MQVSELFIHPVKSCAPQAVERIELEPWGPVGDRRWAVTDDDGHVVTARTLPALLSISARHDQHTLVVTVADGTAVVVEEPRHARSVEVNVSRMPVAVDGGDAAADLLSRACGRELRLVWQPDPLLRSVNPTNGGLPGEVLSLADAGPLLLTSTASLRRLQEWIGPQAQVSMGRFRPNIVIDGEAPFDEDSWSNVQIGNAEFRVQEDCDRCVMTTIDPVSLDRGEEPMTTLRRHRARGRDVFFGVRLVPVSEGHVDVGDQAAPSRR